MAMRTFCDRTGREWRVWAVTPSIREERRSGERRAAAREQVEPERRQLADRREGPDRRINALADGSRGWLCFESGEEKKRYGRLPAALEDLGEAELQTLLRAAAPRLRGGCDSPARAS